MRLANGEPGGTHARSISNLPCGTGFFGICFRDFQVERTTVFQFGELLIVLKRLTLAFVLRGSRRQFGLVLVTLQLNQCCPFDESLSFSVRNLIDTPLDLGIEHGL